jgi:chemotaxis protein histidine kinase CheA
MRFWIAAEGAAFMSELAFAERIAAVRARFIAKFADKLQETDAALPDLAGDEASAANAVEAAYRRFHDICGIGPTIGFAAIGQSAKVLDAILIAPFRSRRGLSFDELARFKQSFETLRACWRIELDTIAANTDSATLRPSELETARAELS